MAWALVQSATKAPVSPSASVSASFASAVTAGNRVFVLVNAESTGTAQVPTTPTDNQGNTYTQLLTNQLNTDNPWFGLYTAVVGSTGTLTVTVNGTPLTASGSQIGFAMLEFSGLSTATGTGCLDQSATNTGTTGTSFATGTTGATTAANQLALAFLVDWGASGTTTYTTSTTGFSKVAGASIDANTLGDIFVATKNSASGATESCTVTSSSSAGAELMGIVVIKLAPAASSWPGVPHRVLQAVKRAANF